MSQPLAALEVAHRVRAERSRLRYLVALGELTLADVIDSPAVASCPVATFVCWAPGVGDVRSRRLLIRSGIPASRLVGELTERQRRALVEGP